MSKKAYKKKQELTPAKILILVALAALLVYFGSTFPKNITAYLPDDILSYSVKYVTDIQTGEQGGYLTGSYEIDDQTALDLTSVLAGQMYRRQIFGTGHNTVDAEGMVEVTFAPSQGEWFSLRCYSDGTLLMSRDGGDYKPYRSGWGFGRNSQQLFRDLLTIFAD